MFHWIWWDLNFKISGFEKSHVCLEGFEHPRYLEITNLWDFGIRQFLPNSKIPLVKSLTRLAREGFTGFLTTISFSTIRLPFFSIRPPFLSIRTPSLSSSLPVLISSPSLQLCSAHLPKVASCSSPRGGVDGSLFITFFLSVDLILLCFSKVRSEKEVWTIKKVCEQNLVSNHSDVRVRKIFFLCCF